MRNRILVVLFVVLGMTSCSGDDTEVEVIPEQKVVEPEPSEEVMPEPEPTPEPDYKHFPVLKSWGSEDGLINVAKDNAGNCIDSLISRKAAFPAPVSRNITTEWPYMKVECNPNLFVTPGILALDLNKGSISRVTGFSTLMERNNAGEWVGGRNSGIVFVKNKVSSRSSSPAVGGYVYAYFHEDSNEYRDRDRLNDYCGEKPLEGVIGDWQATKTESQFRFCVRLDSLPGSVKCVLTDHNGHGVFGDSTNSVKLYRDGRFVDLDPPLEGFTSRSAVGLSLFSNGDYQGADRLCYLFDEGDKGECEVVCEYRETYIRCGLGDPDPDCQPSPDDPSGSTKLVEVEFCRCK